MPEFSGDGFLGLWLPGRRLDGQFGVAVIIKRCFEVDPVTGQCDLDTETTQLVLAPEFEDEDNPERSGIRRPSEVALEKPRVDIMVYGRGFAPQAGASEFTVRLAIADVLDERLEVLGPRRVTWEPPRKRLTKRQLAALKPHDYPPPKVSEPSPLAELPIRYAYAYGGAGCAMVESHIAEAASLHAEQAQRLEERRARKAEIEAELVAQLNEPALHEQGDEEAKRRFNEAFREGDGERGLDGVERLDESLRLEASSQAAESQLIESSPMVLRRDETAGSGAGGDANEGGEAEEAAFDAEQGSVEGTMVLGISSVDEEGQVDLPPALTSAKQLTESGTAVIRLDDGPLVPQGEQGWEEALLPVEEPLVAEADPYAERRVPYPANPAGMGFCISPMKEGVDGLSMPQIRYPGAGLSPEDIVVDLGSVALEDLPPAAGFAPYPPGWYPRARYAGVMPWDLDAANDGLAAAIAAYDPEDPHDAASIEALRGMHIPLMRAEWYQEAHPNLQVDSLDGDEEVLLENLTPEGRLFFRLPGVHPKVSLLRDGVRHPLTVRLDTLFIDLDDPSEAMVTQLWRGWWPLVDESDLEALADLRFELVLVDQKAMRATEGERGRSASQGAEGTMTMRVSERAKPDAPEATEAPEDLQPADRSAETWDDPHREAQSELRAMGEGDPGQEAIEAQRAIRAEARARVDAEFGITDQSKSKDK